MIYLLLLHLRSFPVIPGTGRDFFNFIMFYMTERCLSLSFSFYHYSATLFCYNWYGRITGGLTLTWHELTGFLFHTDGNSQIRVACLFCPCSLRSSRVSLAPYIPFCEYYQLVSGQTSVYEEPTEYFYSMNPGHSRRCTYQKYKLAYTTPCHKSILFVPGQSFQKNKENKLFQNRLIG